MKLHAFVAMPFGRKPGADGQLIDFDRIYGEYVRPALEAAGLEAFRADEEQRPGDIRVDMFQELLLADLVVADLTLDNPNVWYELGVRHALRARGVILVCGGRVSTAFDVYTERKLRYRLDAGVPHPDTLEADRQALTTMAREAMKSWAGRKISPVYQLLPNLKEPDWKSLRIGAIEEFWEKQDAWLNRIELAGKARRAGDILVLADEAPVAALRAEAWLCAGRALRKAEHFDFALEQLERALEIDPANLVGLREKGICLQRLALAGAPGHSLERARQHYRKALEQHPRDVELLSQSGRVDKDAWVGSWRQAGAAQQNMRHEAAYEDALLRAAVERYWQAYRSDPKHYYSGINALALMLLHENLVGDGRYRREIGFMPGAVRFAAECEQNEEGLFWAKATLADLEVLVGTPASVASAYKECIARSKDDWFALNACLAQLKLLQHLGYRPECVEVGIAAFERALAKLSRPHDPQPDRVFLFSGHMIDAPGRLSPRFPQDKEGAAAREIAAALDRHHAGPGDLALAQAAAGGDLLFLETCRQRGVRCQILLPFDEPQFIQRSMLPSADGAAWKQRYLALKAGAAIVPRIMPVELGPLPEGVDPFERCNLWLLYSALAFGVDKVRFICLWNGGGGDGPGGAAHMYEEVKRRTGQVDWIDTRTLG
ncbi:MAG TPA: tetratricopeptide repeat protein [Rhodocyclaceae bacterium]|nr:tetratricopeptide repeat protein [Rhodocyclaceae bacterium]